MLQLPFSVEKPTVFSAALDEAAVRLYREAWIESQSSEGLMDFLVSKVFDVVRNSLVI